MPEPGRDQHQCGLAIGKGPNDSRAPPHFVDDALERIIGTDLSPVGARERVVAQRLIERLADERRSLPQLQRGQLRGNRFRLQCGCL